VGKRKEQNEKIVGLTLETVHRRGCSAIAFDKITSQIFIEMAYRVIWCEQAISGRRY